MAGPPGELLGLGAGLGRRLGPALAAAVVATAALQRGGGAAAAGGAGGEDEAGPRRGAALRGAAWGAWAAGAALWVAVPPPPGGATASFRPETEAAAVLWVVAEVLLLSSSVLAAGGRGRGRGWGASRDAEGRRGRLLAVRCLGALLAGLAGFLLCLVPDLPDARSQQTYLALSGLVFVVGIMVTHGLGGFVMHTGGRRFSPRRLRPPGAEWAFWQPGLGGWVFILCQFFGWGLFVASLVALAWMARALASGFAVGFRTFGVGVAALFVTSQVVIGISVLHFQRGKGTRLEASSAGLPDAGSLQRLLALLLLYTAPHLLLALICLSVAVLRRWAAPAAAGFLSAWYLRRVFDSAGAAGRAWPAFEQWLERHIDAVAEEWLGGVQVIADWAGRRAPVRGGGGRKYVFAYHPHGLYPSGLTWFHRTSQFRQLAPGIRPKALVASVIFWVPLLKELMTWGGGGPVTRANFRRELEEGGVVVLCPGGQAELVETPKAHDSGEIVLCTSHKGFVRIACEQGASLVPVLCFGEIHGVRNLIAVPNLQRYTYKRLGFPIPFLPGGRWGLPVPIPGRDAGPLTFVLGAPVPVPPHLKGRPDVPREEIDALHAQYYEHVRKLFYKHRVAAGFAGATLSFTHPLPKASTD